MCSGIWREVFVLWILVSVVIGLIVCWCLVVFVCGCLLFCILGVVWISWVDGLL